MLERVRQPVKRWPLAIVLGVLVGLAVAIAFMLWPVPDAVVSLLGGPSGGVDRLGGLRVRYRPPRGIDSLALANGLELPASARGSDGSLALEFAGVPEPMVPELTDMLTRGGVTFHVAYEGKHARDLWRYVPPGVTVEVDMWRPEDGSRRVESVYLEAPTRELLERTLAQATSHGWQPAPGTEIALEQGTHASATRWRTYEIASAAALDSTMVASAAPADDSNTGQPIVWLNFTHDGAKRFCELTREIAGHKLAIMLGGRIRSAPVINGPICEGRASITMGGDDVHRQEQEREMLVSVLSRRALPPGGVLEESRWYPPAEIAGIERMGRALMGLVAGALAALLVALGLGAARPYRVAPERVEGRFPVRRLVVTLLAPAALIAGQMFTLPGVNEAELERVMRGANVSLSIVALGVTPILSAFGLVELVALAVPRLRWRRHDPRGRVALAPAVVVVACLIALAQGYFVAVYLQSLSRGPVEVVETGLKVRIVMMATLATGTLLLGVVAGLISQHGLGNGYGALLVSGIAIEVVSKLDDARSTLPAMLDRSRALGLVALLATVVVTVCCLRWRIADGDRRPGFRIPTSGVTPLSDAGGLQAVTWLVTLVFGVQLGGGRSAPFGWSADLLPNPWLALSAVAMLAVLWSWIFARPSLLAPTAQQAGFEPVDRSTWRHAWWRAALTSAFAIVAVAALDAFARAGGGAMPTHPVLAMIAAAVVLDLIDDARARRRALAPAAVLHRIQLVDIVESALAEAEIPCHFHAGNLRTLLAFFGPWAPVIVLVPKELAEAARVRLDGILRTPGARAHSE